MNFYKLGLTGYPITYSVSPQIHNAALEEAGLDGEYKLYPVAPNDKQGFADLLVKMRAGETHGLNVTIPHKQNVMPLLDKLSPTAETIGAVNTISLQNGELVGDNTDAGGFWNDLQPLLAKKVISNKYALILGAGGSARAVAYALIQHGWNVNIAARRIEQAESLVAHYSSPQITATCYESTTFHPLLPTLDLIVNTTPVGMTSHPQGSPWPEGLAFPSQAVLYDLIYNPTETQLMRDAKKTGLATRNGLGMLIRQALLSFEIWTRKNVSAEKIDLS